MSSDFSFDSDSSSVEILPEFGGPSESAGPACDKCGTPFGGTDSMVCRKCGWYASIGSYVELDRQWETAIDPGLEDEAAVREEEKFKLPPWAWVLIGCLGFVAVESIAARFLTAEGSALRTTWSVTQLFAGLTVLVACHFVAYVVSLNEDSNTGIMDFLLRPLRTWSVLISELPAKQGVLQGAASGGLAAVLSLLLIGGIPYERLLDWGTKAPPKQNLMGAMMEQAQKIEGKEQSLEEAVSDLAGKAELDEKKKEKPKAPPVVRQKEDCVILGYQTNAEGRLDSLLLGAASEGKIRYAGKVRPELTPEEQQELLASFESARASQPFAKVPVGEAIWLKPRFVCRVSFTKRSKSGKLGEVEFEEMLAEVDLGR